MPLRVRFLGFWYFKIFSVFFVALEFFFVGIDLIKFLDNLPNSANLMILLIAYDFAYASNFILPLSLVLAQITLFLTLLKSSQFTAFLALGYSRWNIFSPMVLVALLVTLCFIILQATPFAYAKEKVDAIVDKGYIESSKNDLFVKFNESYIYFEKVYPVLEKSENIKIYQIHPKTREVQKIIYAKEAFFDGLAWNLLEVLELQLPSEIHIGRDTPIVVTQQENLKILEGFRPKILDSIYEQDGYLSLVDIVETLYLMQNQNIDSNSLIARLYYGTLFPLFAPLVMILLAYFTPNSNRYVNLSLLGLGMVLGVLLIWGVLFSFTRLSVGGFLNPNLGIILPMILLLCGSVLAFRQIREN